MTRPYTHATEKLVNEYVDLVLGGDRAIARHLRVKLIKYFQYTREELDIFVEERLIEIDNMLKEHKFITT